MNCSNLVVQHNFTRKALHHLKKNYIIGGASLVVQWLRLHASTAGGAVLIPGWGTKTPHAAWHGQKKPQKQKNSIVGKFT